jgi:hypothetical protein
MGMTQNAATVRIFMTTSNPVLVPDALDGSLADIHAAASLLDRAVAARSVSGLHYSFYYRRAQTAETRRIF